MQSIVSRSLSKQATLVALRQSQVVQIPQAFVSFDDKRAGEENKYARKQEKESLKKLLKIMEQERLQQSEANIHQLEGKLHDLCKQHGVEANESLITDLMEWKFK